MLVVVGASGEGDVDVPGQLESTADQVADGGQDGRGVMGPDNTRAVAAHSWPRP